MPSNFIFTESSPSTTTYIRSGRGGAGNTFRATDLPSATTATRSSSASSGSTFAPRRFFSGIGGAGNVQQADQHRPALLRSLEEVTPDTNPSVGYCGRGGAGNVYRRKASDAGSVASSGSTASSVSEKAKMWAQRTFSKE